MFVSILLKGLGEIFILEFALNYPVEFIDPKQRRKNIEILF